MCVPTKAEAQHIFFWKQKLRMLAESLTHEQRNKNAILYLLVAKPEKNKWNEIMFSSFSLKEWSSYGRWKVNWAALIWWIRCQSISLKG